MLLFPKAKPPLIPRIEPQESIPGMISVITPAYNAGRFLEGCIQSVSRQEYPHREHIVVDGGSQDGTVEILQRYPHLRWLSEPDRGQSHALNKGVGLAKGEFIFWLNADDELLPGALADVLASFQAAAWGLNPRLSRSSALKRTPESAEADLSVLAGGLSRRPDVLVYGFEMMDEAGAYLGEKLPGPRMAWMDGRFSPVDCFPTPAIAFRRQVVEQIGGFDETLQYPMDLEFLCRARAQGCGVRFVDRHAVRFRMHDESKTAGPHHKLAVSLQVYEMHRRFWPPGLGGARYWWRSGILRGTIYQNAAIETLAKGNYWRGALAWTMFILNNPRSIIKKDTWGILLRALKLRG